MVVKVEKVLQELYTSPIQVSLRGSIRYEAIRQNARNCITALGRGYRVSIPMQPTTDVSSG